MASGLHLTVLCLTAGLWFAASAPGQVSDDSEACPSVFDDCETCPSGWIDFERSCYQFFFAEKDWADAERHCTSIGGNLASVQNKEEYDFLRSTVFQLTSKHTSVWLGGYDAVKENVWLWSNGLHFDFKLWADGEPNNYGGNEHCMQMNFREKETVNDFPCDRKMSYFCQQNLRSDGAP